MVLEIFDIIINIGLVGVSLKCCEHLFEVSVFFIFKMLSLLLSGKPFRDATLLGIDVVKHVLHLIYFLSRKLFIKNTTKFEI
jgi:hypothetical protein